MTNYTAQAQSIIRRLKELNMAPSQGEQATIGPFKIVNVYNEVNSPIISDSVSTGFDRDVNLAALKALVEWTERRAFEYGLKNGQSACQTERSDGFAAYPVKAESHRELARQNALAEAIERFVWASWWDNQNIAADIFEAQDFSDEESELLALIDEISPISKAFRIEPKFNNFDEHEVLIYFIELHEGGFISGGACGLKNQRTNTVSRAMSELLRHVNASHLIREGRKQKTFYEKRLAYFLTDAGSKKAQERLSLVGSEFLTLPKLAIDDEVLFPANDVVYVHRCLFKDQPPFVGGALERLCI